MPHNVVAADELTLLVDIAKASESVFAVDSACRIVFLNVHAEALLGYRASDVLGGFCSDALRLAAAPGSRACALCLGAIGRRGSQPSSSHFVVSALTQSGERIWLRVLALPAVNAAGERRTVHVLRAVESEESAYEDTTFSPERPAAPLLDAPNQSAREVGGANARAYSMRKSQLLTRRELEVLQLLAGGLSTATIGAQLSISPVTARNHVTSIIDKLGAKTRLQAVVMASRMGLLVGRTL